LTYSFSLSFDYYYMFVVYRLYLYSSIDCAVAGSQPAQSILHSASFCFPAARSPAKCCTRFRACCASFLNGIGYNITDAAAAVLGSSGVCCCWRCAAGAGRARINRCRACGPQTQPLFSRLFAGRWPAGLWAPCVFVSYIHSAGSK
jgi:hypothetical protein